MSEIEKAKAALEPGSRWRHQKTGHAYELVGVGKMQAANWYELDECGDLINGGNVDMCEVSIYRAEDDGVLWVRPREEFEDGRFEALSALQVPSAPAEMGGWKLVPVEPTRAMRIAYDEKCDSLGLDQFANLNVVWPVLLEYAPSAHAPVPDSEKDEIARLTRELEHLDGVVRKIDAIRNSIIGFQTVSWSEHVYPLVAALHEAGFEGQGYEEARANALSLLAVTDAAEARATELEGQVAALVEALGKARIALAGYTSADEAAYAIDVALGSLDRALLARIQPALNGQEAGR